MIASLNKLSEGLQGISEFLKTAYTINPELMHSDHEDVVAIASSVADSKSPNGEKEKVTRKRTPKDPNAPKLPMGPYLLYLQDRRSQMKGSSHENVPHSEFMKEVGTTWRTLTAEEREVMYLI